MAFTAIDPADVQSDKPITTTLMDRVRTNFDDHENRISQSSGIIGEVVNGSFETAQGGNPTLPDKWACGSYAGGQVLLDTIRTMHGKKSLKMIHSVAGGGGGYAESDYIAISPMYCEPLNFAYWAEAAGMVIQVVARYYASDANGDPGLYLGERTIFSNSANMVQMWMGVQINYIPNAYLNARYVKYRLIGGANGSSVTGTVYFDAVGISLRRVVFPLDNPNPINLPDTRVYTYDSWGNAGPAFSITIPEGFRWLIVRVKLAGSSYTDEFGTTYYPIKARFFLNGGPSGRYSTEQQSVSGSTGYYQAPPDGNYQQFDLVYDLSGVAAGTYTLQFQARTAYAYHWMKCVNLVHECRNGLLIVNGQTLAITDSVDNLPIFTG